jgi:hypothetical protein
LEGDDYDLSGVHLPGGIPNHALANETKRKEKTMRKRLTLLGLAAFSAVLYAAIFSHAAAKPGSSGYHVIKTVSVPGDEGWDYVYVDSDARPRVSHRGYERRHLRHRRRHS